MRRNGSGGGCTGKIVEKQAPLHVYVREREREAGASDIKPNARTEFGIRRGEGCAMVLDLVMGWVLLVFKVRLN